MLSVETVGIAKRLCTKMFGLHPFAATAPLQGNQAASDLKLHENLGFTEVMLLLEIVSRGDQLWNG
jgi:hypothetical protein